MSTVADTIPLDALSARQRRRVQENLPLVQLTVDRIKADPTGQRAPSDVRDLIQEGSLALAEAVRNHDPTRHGDFATYAMARVHQAVGRFLNEDESLIRVPYIAQRRHRSRSHDPREASPRTDDAPADRERLRPDRIPSIKTRGSLANGILHSRFPHVGSTNVRPGPTLNIALRHRIDRARRRAIECLLRDAGRDIGEQRVIHACDAHRWSMLDPSQQTSFRALALLLNCAPSRLFRCEKRLRETMAAVLAADRAFNRLVELARIRRHGWRHILDPEDYTFLRHGPAAAIDLQT
ncbi:MAG: hypothetical protein HZA51_06050 [Planctomycetes bacterium]|nr:hypothetical protein [Planctomycetota bacterium]